MKIWTNIISRILKENWKFILVPTSLQERLVKNKNLTVTARLLFSLDVSWCAGLNVTTVNLISSPVVTLSQYLTAQQQQQGVEVIQVNLFQNLFFLQNMGRISLLCTEIVLNVKNNMFSPCSELGIFMYWTCNSMKNLSSYCGLVDAKMGASDKDLPVKQNAFLSLDK